MHAHTSMWLSEQSLCHRSPPQTTPSSRRNKPQGPRLFFSCPQCVVPRPVVSRGMRQGGSYCEGKVRGEVHADCQDAGSSGPGRVSKFGFCCSDKHQDRKQLSGRKGFIRLTLPCQSSSILEGRQGTTCHTGPWACLTAVVLRLR